MTPLDGWDSFYVIVGSSAGALIGLQFVVMTLVADMPAPRRDPQAGSAFSTPSVVHFGVVLLLSAIASAPWNRMAGVAVPWGLVGLCGALYTLIVVRRLRAQTIYKPVGEDWLFHVALPFAAYAMLVVSAFMAPSHARPALFLVGAVALALLFIGIHNAWDIVMYQIFVGRQDDREGE
jgi:hypothetical protein